MFNVAVHQDPRFLLVVGSGRGDLSEVMGLADFASRVAAMKGIKRTLIDLLAVDQEFTPAEHESLGAHLARSLPHVERVAVVVPAQYRVGTGEKAAQMKGLPL